VALAVVLDANILYPIALTDFFLSTSIETSRFRVHWSTEILREVEDNLVAKHPSLKKGVAARIADMTTAFPEALIDPPAGLVNVMTNDPGDRHVLATAVAAGAQIIVTSNVKHFPASACDPYGIMVQDPDSFAEWIVAADPAGTLNAIEGMSTRRRKHPMTVDEIIERLARDMPRAMDTCAASRH